MENLYQIPRKGSSTKEERELFWRQVLEEQKKSGLSGSKFCQQHHLSFSTFKNRKYRLQELDAEDSCDESAKDKDHEENHAKPHFVPLHIISDNQATEDTKFSKIKIIFRNGHVIEFSIQKMGNALHEIIAEVSRLPC